MSSYGNYDGQEERLLRHLERRSEEKQEERERLRRQEEEFQEESRRREKREKEKESLGQETGYRLRELWEREPNQAETQEQEEVEGILKGLWQSGGERQKKWRGQERAIRARVEDQEEICRRQEREKREAEEERRKKEWD